ncbi:methyltransferase domain-containing protein [Sphingomonas sp. IC-56]|uniref:class I SAM-dependent methyltransferase n=1 Tax=Sphingomonas sp. IC-56 TaxID=2898529 RepID=UPI001E37BC2C|nr:methyltransferase domain-containing protein [Sphingomonas sp. IC-56]MCD2323210.1 methyltransferase domain-containing protein [Sphingomonas sp. IC-56]
MRLGLALLAAVLLAGCDGRAREPGEKRADPHSGFPAADRPVASIVSARWSTEEARDRLKEADRVMNLAGIKPGMTVADLGAGEGYYTIRLGQRVGKEGRVVAEDIVPEVIERLGERVVRERLANVSVRLGLPADPRLPEASFHRVLMVHMYHEIESPYEFLWRLRPSLAPDGQVIVVDANRPTVQHGTPPDLLRCEFAAVGYAQMSMRAMPSAGGYMAVFRAAGERPEPNMIKACRTGARATPAAMQQGSE